MEKAGCRKSTSEARDREVLGQVRPSEPLVCFGCSRPWQDPQAAVWSDDGALFYCERCKRQVFGQSGRMWRVVGSVAEVIERLDSEAAELPVTGGGERVTGCGEKNPKDADAACIPTMPLRGNPRPPRPVVRDLALEEDRLRTKKMLLGIAMLESGHVPRVRRVAGDDAGEMPALPVQETEAAPAAAQAEVVELKPEEGEAMGKRSAEANRRMIETRRRNQEAKAGGATPPLSGGAPEPKRRGRKPAAVATVTTAGTVRAAIDNLPHGAPSLEETLTCINTLKRMSAAERAIVMKFLEAA